MVSFLCHARFAAAVTSRTNFPMPFGYVVYRAIAVGLPWLTRVVGVFLSTASFCQIDAQQHNDTPGNLIDPHALVQ